MRLSRIFVAQPLILSQPVTLDQPTSHYLLNVLRLRLSDHIIVFNGEGGEYQASLVEISRKSVIIQLNAFNAKDLESPLIIELGQALSQTDHWRYVLQKSVELGVAAISPLITERSYRINDLSKKMTHWRAILQSAAEQSGRTRIPILNTPCSLAEWLNQPYAGMQLMADPLAELSSREMFASSEFKTSDSNKQDLNTQSLNTQDLNPQNFNAKDLSTQTEKLVRVLIGAEGGLSDSEREKAKAHGFQAVRLGPRVLRTETATVAFLTLLQYWGGDL